ncbi:MAG TPA: Gfo/Idh/MocA family oxidoreductase [Candidatus Hydrogenedentes bacterium]|nr:Gfo/Idh/MocA family oxidoreductase [Candidatus Hydrogenedentota bacterium]
MRDELKIGFIGAGDVNFGGGEGPWDHASRLERLGGVRVVGVADPDTGRAKAQLAKREGPMYRDARVYADHRTMLAEAKPDAVWIGVPPNAHGTAEVGKDIELACVRAGVPIFVEKPLSSARPERVRKVAEKVSEADVVTSVGYMFRYARAIDAIKAIIDETDGGAKAFLARYDCAYSEIRKREWWDVRASGGPIVEQATHFVDLARYLIGDVDIESIKALSIGGGDPAGRLLDVPVLADGTRCGADVPPEFAAARVTAAVWRFANGAVGSLTHGTLLHRKKYETELEVWGDGLRIALLDPYGDCRALVRRPHSEDAEEMAFSDDDPYLTEDEAFLDAVRTGDRSRIRSPYGDALKTFELTWAITDAAAA